MSNNQCKKCHGNGNEMCKDSGTLIESPCEACDGTGQELRTYYANVLVHKNIGDHPFMGSTMFESILEALQYRHREFIVIKTIEIKV